MAIGLRVLGTTRLVLDGRPQSISSQRQRRILAALAAAGGNAMSADLLVDVVWGERLPANPKGALQTQLTRIRELFRPAVGSVVYSDPSGYGLALERSDVDAWRFEDLLVGSLDELRSPTDISEALSLWDGEAFVDADKHPAVQPVASRLDALRRDAIEALASAQLSENRPDAALATIEPLLAEDPYRESACVVELRALCAAGRTTEALVRCRQHRRTLADDLGLETSQPLQAIEREILHPAATAAPQIPTPGDGSPPQPPPLPVTSFLGRRRELEEIHGLLERARIVTVVGPGGVGKTRLVLQAVHDNTDHTDGIFWCDLASSNSDNVGVVVASRIGVQERSGGSPADWLADFLANRRCLVVLDNCEHVSDGAAALADTIARRGPGPRVLATSRQPLGVDGEHLLRLDPLGGPASGEDATADVQLFFDRALAAAPGFTADAANRSTVAELCGRLGGLPLAIELAAACVTRMDLDTLCDRIAGQLELLDRSTVGAGDRHGSLDGVLASSYQLLQPAERELLERLSVFSGGFTLTDAERLIGSLRSGAGREVGGLVDKSMVLFHRDDGHYELLPPVRTFGRAHLAARGERERWRARHTTMVLEKAADIDRALRTPEERVFRSALDDAAGDFRTARDWLTEIGDDDGLMRLSACTHWFATLRTRSELSRWAEDAIVRVGQSTDRRGTGRVRACAAIGASRRGDLANARRLAQQGARDPADERRFGIEVLGQVNLFEGRLDDAISCSRAASEHHRAVGDQLFATSAASVEAAALAYGGHLMEGEALARALSQQARDLGVPSLYAMTLYILAEATAEPAIAAESYNTSISIARSVNADFVTGLANTSLAALEVRAGRVADARRRLAGAIELWQKAGVRTQQWLAIRLMIEALDHDNELEMVATLAGAYEASTRAGPAFGDDATRLARAVNRACEQLGGDRFGEAHRRGSILTEDGAADLARSSSAPA
jgi:predicted ATPase/DNA-binding SARP family transcriptional activator